MIELVVLFLLCVMRGDSLLWHARIMIRGQLLGTGSLHCVNPGYQTQVVRTGGKHLYPLNQLSGSCFSHEIQGMKFSVGTSPMGT